MAKRKTMADVQAKHPRVQDESLRYVTPELVADEPQLSRWMSKQVVVRLCGRCDEPFDIATSDLHQKPNCDACTVLVRKERKAAKKAARTD